MLVCLMPRVIIINKIKRKMFIMCLLKKEINFNYELNDIEIEKHFIHLGKIGVKKNLKR